MTGEQLLPVEQADRRRAASTVSDDGSHASYMMCDGIISGRMDDSPLVQAFARHRHRLASTPTALPGAEDVALRFEETPLGKALCDRRALAAGDFKDPQHQGQRGCDWDAGFIAACRIVEKESPRASDEVPAQGQWCSGCKQVRTVDCYLPQCPIAAASDEVPANPVGEVEALRKCVAVIEMFKDAGQLSEGVHVGLRKGTDASDAHKLWSVIAESDTSAWSDAIGFALDPYFSMWGGDEALEEARAALKSADATSSQEQGASGEVAK